MHKQISKLAPLGLTLGLFLSTSGIAQDEQESAADEEIVYDEFTVQCISLRQIRRTEVVDDRNILFYMSGQTVYHNRLPRLCGGLAREDRFSYQTNIGRLCRIDHIRVLYDDPFGLREGNRCALGVFHKMDREGAKAIKEGAAQQPAANPLPMPKPEEVGDANEE
ncbi:MAG: hypothetical protein ACR2QR_02605 [Woeseiaceae bacterium]